MTMEVLKETCMGLHADAWEAPAQIFCRPLSRLEMAKQTVVFRVGWQIPCRSEKVHPRKVSTRKATVTGWLSG